jgi:molybdopterin biosynthesis enzyme
MLVRPVKNPTVAIARPNLGLPLNPYSSFNCFDDMLDTPINSLQK